MNELDESRWEKVERLADKMAYTLEAITRLKTEAKAALLADDLGVLPEILVILWEISSDKDVIEAKELFVNIANTRTDRICYKP